jgi:NADH-quinone oxidoreductase subunit A
MLDQYIGVVFTFVLAGLIVGIMCGASMVISRLLGTHRPSLVKGQVFECGNPPTGPARGRFSVRFYLVAILFLVFDVEVVFMYPWAIVFRRLGVPGLVDMLLFIGVLGAGLGYVWKKGALAWD